MAERRRQLSEELRYRLLKQLESNPDLSQGELADTLDISVGKANDCVRLLVEKGWVTPRSVRSGGNRHGYRCSITRRGLPERAVLAVEFLDVRMREVESLRLEVARRREGGFSPSRPRTETT